MQNKNTILENSALQTTISILFGLIGVVPSVMLSGAEDTSRLEAYLSMFIPFGLLIAAIMCYLVINRMKKRTVTMGAKITFKLHAQTFLSVVLGSVVAVIFGYALIGVLTTQTKSSVPGYTLMIVGIIGAGVTACIGLILIGLQQRSKQALKKKLERKYGDE